MSPQWFIGSETSAGTSDGAGWFPSATRRGLTIHYTAGGSAESSIEYLLREKPNLGYHIVIARDGAVHQMTAFNRRVNHAGNALWNGLVPNDSHYAVALASWGRLERNDAGVPRCWTGKVLPKECAKTAPDILGHMGYWEAATSDQMVSLVSVIQFFLDRGISADDICGHDECAVPTGRKTDPGGVILRSLPAIRYAIKTYGSRWSAEILGSVTLS